MNGLSLLHQRRNNVVNPAQLSRGCGEALAALAADSLVFVLCKLGVIEVTPEFTAAALLATVADIGRLLELLTNHFLKVWTDSEALDLTTLATKLTEL